MSKISRAIGIIAVAAALGFSITSCDTSFGGSSLVGTWLASEEIGSYTMTFRGSMASGGEVEFVDHPYHGSYTAEWSVNRNELTIVGYSWTLHIGVYTFSIDGNTLTRVHRGSGDILVYTRQ